MAKILIVEDNALNIKLFCDLLAAHGHEPQAVTDSRQALDAAREFAPDLVITDIQLPHVSGLDLIRFIRADEQLKEVPIMAVTAYASIGDEERIRGAGAESYVTKPISVARFVQEVDFAGPEGAGRSGSLALLRAYLIFASLNSTCLRATGSYLRKTIFSVWFRGFFLVT